jgi:hypothetical protein
MRHRNIIIAGIAAAALMAASATALARGGGMGGGHMGGGHMGGMGGMHMGGGWGGHVGGMGLAGHAAFGRVGPVGFAGARSLAWHGNHVAFGHFPFRHRFFVRNRFFFGAPYAYAYYNDGCYTRVWTPWGWQWANVCGY